MITKSRLITAGVTIGVLAGLMRVPAVKRFVLNTQ